MNKTRNGKPTQPVVRCAIYTRKSTEEGLQQEFNSLDNQRESAEAYIRSQHGEGWTLLPDRYDDGGFSGGTMERPALRRLLADIEAGRIDLVVTYKVDRLSRSLLDFARLMDCFERHHVSFAAVTQQFNSATSMGRLTLNVLLSFAQFEREIISERTRDKIAATRRKGKWAGGHPILGYDLSTHSVRLVINEAEAERVRQIFGLYLEHESLLPVVQELNRRGWTTKRWTTQSGAGEVRGGKVFTKTALHKLLTNVVYRGLVRYKTETHPGEHQGIIDVVQWQRVQTLLQRNGRSGGAGVRGRSGAMLQGLLRCVPCGCVMVPSTTRKGNKKYAYYVCIQAQKRGWHTCPSKSIPAGEIERFVVDRLRSIGRDPGLLRQTLNAIGTQIDAEKTALAAEQQGLTTELERHNNAIHTLVDTLTQGSRDNDSLERLADQQKRVRHGEQRSAEIRDRIQTLDREQIDEADVEAALAAFDPLWAALAPAEQCRIVRLLVAGIDYDGSREVVTIRFEPTGIRTLAGERTSLPQEKRA